MTEILYHQTVPVSNWDNIWQLWNEIDNTVGLAKYAYTYLDGFGAVQAGYAPVSGNYTVFVLTFQVKSVGNCTLHIDTELATDDGNPIVHEAIDGFFSNTVPPPPLPPPPSPETQAFFHLCPRAVKNESLTVNSTFSVEIELDIVDKSASYVGYSFDLTWNGTLLRCLGVGDVLFHQIVPQTNWINISSGTWPPENVISTVHYGCSLPPRYEPAIGNHTVAVATFLVISIGKCPLQLFNCKATNLTAVNLVSVSKNGYFSNAMNGDLNGDHTVDLFDALLMARSFGCCPESQMWNEDADINGDMNIDIYDALLLCARFGRTS